MGPTSRPSHLLRRRAADWLTLLRRRCRRRLGGQGRLRGGGAGGGGGRWGWDARARVIQVAIQGCAADADRLGDLLHGVLPAGEQLTSDAQLLLGDHGPAAAAPPAGARRLQARLGALADELALELGDRPEDVEHQPTRRARGVDPLRQAAKTEPALPELANQLDQMPQAPAQAIQPPHHQHVLAVTQLLQRPLELRPFAQRPRRGVAEPPLTPGRFERVELQRDVLIASRDTGIANQHTPYRLKTRRRTRTETLAIEPSVAGRRVA